MHNHAAKFLAQIVQLALLGNVVPHQHPANDRLTALVQHWRAGFVNDTRAALALLHKLPAQNTARIAPNVAQVAP